MIVYMIESANSVPESTEIERMCVCVCVFGGLEPGWFWW